MALPRGEVIESNSEHHTIQGFFKLVGTNNLEEDFECPYFEDDNTFLLHTASGLGDLEQCETLINQGVDVNTLDYQYWTPLMHSARNGHPEVLKLLLKAGADPNKIPFRSSNLFNLAIASGSLETVDYLFKNLPQPSEKCKMLEEVSFLATGSSYGFEDIAKYLLDKFPESIDKASPITGMTPLMLAVCGGHVRIVELLLAHKCKTELRNSQGQSAREMALWFGNQQIRKLLKAETTPDLPQHLILPEISFDAYEPEHNSTSSLMNSPLANQLFRVPSQFDSNSLQTRNFTHTHPLTPNAYLSPSKKTKYSKKIIKFPQWLRLNKKRSKSAQRNCKTQNEIKNENLLKNIILAENLSEYWPLFEENEITLGTFLTMTDDDLLSIGIQNIDVRLEFSHLIRHYKRIFLL